MFMVGRAGGFYFYFILYFLFDIRSFFQVKKLRILVKSFIGTISAYMYLYPSRSQKCSVFKSTKRSVFDQS